MGVPSEDWKVQYLANACFWLCSLGTFFCWFSFPSTNFYWQQVYDKKALLFMTTAYSLPAIFVQSAQAYFDKKVNERFGKVKAYLVRITLCLSINITIAASAPFLPKNLWLFIAVIFFLGVASSAAYGAFFQLVTLFPRSTTSFLSFGYSSPGIILPFVAIGIFGTAHDTAPKNVITFFSITSTVCFVGLMAFYCLIYLSRDMLNAGERKAQDREALVKKIRSLKEQRERESGFDTTSGPSSIDWGSGSIQATTSESRSVKWADLEKEAEKQRKLEKAARSASLDSERAISLRNQANPSVDEEEVLLDEDTPIFGAGEGEEAAEDDNEPVLVAADVPITFDTAKFSRLSMSQGGNTAIIGKIWPCGLALLICNVSRLLVMNSLPEIPSSETLKPSLTLSQTLIFITLGCDLAGRLLTLIPLPREWWAMPYLILGAAVFQFLSLDLFFLYLFQAPHNPFVPYSDIGAKVFMGLFSTTTGFLITQCYLVAPMAVKSVALRPQVGALMNVFSQVGNVIALAVGFSFAYTIFSKPT